MATIWTHPLRTVSSRAWSASRSGAHHEFVVFTAGAATFALHVADDNFLQPEPGVSASDHLVSGLVPISLLAIAVSAFSHLRASLRATLALFVGALGLIMGLAEAGYYSLKVGPSGDDYTGLLSIPAGVLLLGLGAVILWQMRQFNDSRRRRYARRTAFAALGIVFSLIVLPLYGGAYVFTHSQRILVPAADLGALHEDVTFSTEDGIKLEGWFVPSTNGATIIVYPGRTGTQAHARMLVRNGYGVLLFDRRGEGASGGDVNPWAGDRDLRAAIAFLVARPEVDPQRIGGIGLSVGGELLLQTAAESEELKAIVSEGAGVRTLGEQLARSEAIRWIEVPGMLVYTAAMMVLSNHLPPPDLMDSVEQISPRSIMLIYATDGMGGEDLNPLFYESANEPKVIWEITVGSHVGGIKTIPDEYERRVIAFLNEALLSDQ